MPRARKPAAEVSEARRRVALARWAALKTPKQRRKATAAATAASPRTKAGRD
jgi:hypothetical protein